MRAVAAARIGVQSARTMGALRRHHASTGIVTCEGRPPVIVGGGEIRLGRVALRAPRVAISLGAEPGGSLDIGDRVFVNEGASIVAVCDIRIGPDCRIGDFVAIHDGDYHPVDQETAPRSAAVRIGRNVWIARSAIVLPGVEIGDHAVVGAGAVVTRDVEARTLVAGNPARPLRALSAAESWRRP